MNAIEKIKGPCIILAGAGTGKTFTIVEKINYLINNKIYSPEKIVCITFSNEAANNLALRIGKILGNFNGDKMPVIRTFHGFSADLLRKYGDRIGIDKEFKILEPDQAKVILNRNLKVNVNNCHKYISTIGTAKDLGITLSDFQGYLEKQLENLGNISLEKRIESLQFELQTLYLRKDFSNKKKLVSDIKKLLRLFDIKKFVFAWNSYEKLKQKGNYQDYSDLNKNALLLLEKHPVISEDFDYIIIDEFQDTNKLQLDFVFKLATKGNITIVGDLNQSIYRFRGAYKENVNLFKDFFNVKNNEIFNLDKSYRSPNKILRAAHKLILNNYKNKEECFFVENVHNKEGDKIEVYELSNAREEARKVVELVKREIENGVPLEEICVMFRTHQQGRIIKRALDESEIPYFSVSKASLLKQKSVKTARDYLIILDKLKRKEKGGEQAWWDLVYQLNFSPDDLMRIGKAIKNFMKKDDGISNSREIISVYLFNNIGKFELSDDGKIAAKILVEKLKLMLSYLNIPISELVQDVFRISGLINEQRTKEEKEIMLNLNKFYEIVKNHEELYDSDLVNFLYYLEVLENLGIEIEVAQLEESGVRLMTSHSTKGLEYKIVIITNLSQGRFPIEKYTSNNLIPTELLPEVKEHIRDMPDEERDGFIFSYEKHHQLLEERRLAYVSFTRAKEKLILTFADDYGSKKILPSQFLNEIFYKNNRDIEFIIDFDEKYLESKSDISAISEFSSVLKSRNFDEELLSIINANDIEKKSIEKEHNKFSPSALLLFDECQKQFEYKYVYNMPEKKIISWDSMRLGSFVHLVLEKGVSSGFNKVDDFLVLAREMSMDEDWEGVSIDEIETLIKVFYERNKGRYDEKSKTEQYLSLSIGGMGFMGFADRIDFSEDGVEIVDYKTGKAFISPKDRNWQLGFYALAAKEKYGKVKRVILDMLKQEKPLEFELDEKGNALPVNSDRMNSFNIYEVEQELIKTAHEIQEAYKRGFRPCSIEKNCDFCNEYVYGF